MLVGLFRHISRCLSTRMHTSAALLPLMTSVLLSLSHTQTHTHKHTHDTYAYFVSFTTDAFRLAHTRARTHTHTHTLSLSHTLSHDMHTSAALPPTLSVLPSAIPTNAGAAVGRPAACAMVPPLTLPRSCVTRMPGWVSRRVEVGGKTWVRTHSIVREHIL